MNYLLQFPEALFDEGYKHRTISVDRKQTDPLRCSVNYVSQFLEALFDEGY